tara:strand:+ start:307 stop:729 length:423 start_codon:yes stop_codon:yes gene_type:complete
MNDTTDAEAAAQEMDVSGVRVLVVDDADTVRRVMESRLVGLGCDVRVADGGFPALSLMREFDAEIVFLDISMPDLDGYKTCAVIRNRHPELPIVMLSSHDGIFDIAEGMVHGATEHVTKSPGPDRLREIVYRLCRAGTIA